MLGNFNRNSFRRPLLLAPYQSQPNRMKWDFYTWQFIVIFVISRLCESQGTSITHPLISITSFHALLAAGQRQHSEVSAAKLGKQNEVRVLYLAILWDLCDSMCQRQAGLSCLTACPGASPKLEMHGNIMTASFKLQISSTLLEWHWSFSSLPGTWFW